MEPMIKIFLKFAADPAMLRGPLSKLTVWGIMRT